MRMNAKHCVEYAPNFRVHWRQFIRPFVDAEIGTCSACAGRSVAASRWNRRAG